MGFLSRVMAEVREELQRDPLDEAALAKRARKAPAPRDLVAALRADRPAVIAEIKRASPSAGRLAADLDPARAARDYELGGAAAISVLTEGRHFLGSLDDLRAAREATDLPLLRKDFLFDRSQLIEARAAGADAVLLIAAALDDAELEGLLTSAAELGMGSLVETHSDNDMARVLATSAEVVGVNSRDLESLQVDLPAALARLAAVRGGRVAVLESGISSRADVETALDAGASAILVGEILMRAADPAAKLRELRGKET
jgi:indole-3-glycerol phosphate synthase